MSKRYAKSEKWLERALRSIPLGSQTFSKSKTQYPLGVSPFFITRGQGSHVWDLDGHEYIDFVNSLAAVTLGYNDPDVNAAVRKQLNNGVSFSLPHPLEVDVAEKIIAMVPCAEKVRFAKNGSDATSAAIRLARAHTSRDHVMVGGYHGWHDWHIGSTSQNKGVPECVRSLTHPFKYNDLSSLHAIFKQWPDQVAAVIMEPMNSTEPARGFLESVKELSHQNKAILIFDETITGFRYAPGGAQDLFHVTPDLATFGKGVANGFPLSVVTGSDQLMKGMEEIFFSATFGGETLSLAASRATLKKLTAKNVTQRLAQQGQKVLLGVRSLIEKHHLEELLSISGHPSWTFLQFKDAAPYTSWEIKTLFLQEVFARGILTIGTHNMSFSHSDRDIQKLLKAYDQVFPMLTQAVRERSLNKLLKCKPLQPLFKIR